MPTREAETAITTGRDADLDAIAAYIAFGIRAPVTPNKATDPDVVAGRALFGAANCQGCHGGANWTASTLDFAPPPAAAEITAAQLTRFLCKAGTFDAALANELKGGGVAGQAQHRWRQRRAGHQHPVAAERVRRCAVLPQRRRAHARRSTGQRAAPQPGHGRRRHADQSADRAKLAKFVASIDASTPIFPEKTMNEAKPLCLP